MKTRSKVAATGVLVALLCIARAVASGTSDSPTGSMRINPQGTFGSLGVWIYRTAAGTYGFTDATLGTNEKLVLGPPKLPPGSGISAVWIKRHQFDTLGYPLHIALVEKLFAQSNKIDVMVDDVTGTWSHELGQLHQTRVCWAKVGNQR